MDNIKAAKYIKDHCLGSEVYRDGTQWNDAMVTAVELLERPELKELSVDAIPVDWLNSRIAEFRAKDTYANQFAADFLQAIINEYNKEVYNGKTE